MMTHDGVVACRQVRKYELASRQDNLSARSIRMTRRTIPLRRRLIIEDARKKGDTECFSTARLAAGQARMKSLIFRRTERKYDLTLEHESEPTKIPNLRRVLLYSLFKSFETRESLAVICIYKIECLCLSVPCKLLNLLTDLDRILYNY